MQNVYHWYSSYTIFIPLLFKNPIFVQIFSKDADKLEKINYYRETMKRVKLTSECLPSICFYTLLNANNKYAPVWFNFQI